MHGLSLADCRRRRARGVTGRVSVLSRREASGSAACAVMMPLVDTLLLSLSVPLCPSPSLPLLYLPLFFLSGVTGPNQITQISRRCGFMYSIVAGDYPECSNTDKLKNTDEKILLFPPLLLGSLTLQ